MEAFIDRVTQTRDEIDKNEVIKIKNDFIAITILQGVSQEYDGFIQCLTANAKIIDLEKIKNSLIAEEQRRIDRKQLQNDQQIFHSKLNKDKKKKYFKNIKCYNCNRFGHYANDCRELKKYKKNHKANSNDKNKSNSRIWLLDFGATNHMCWEKNIFKELKPHTSTVIVGDGRSLPVKGKGSIEMNAMCENGKIIKLTVYDALYVPELRTNLISIGKLNKKGYKIIFEDDKYMIQLNEKFMIECKQSNQNENLFELPIMNHVLTNQNTHETVEIRSNLLIIHSHLAGPMRTESIGGKRYMLIFICNKTEYSFIYFLKTKNEQFEKFKEFKSQYELHTNVKIQGLQTDNTSGYLSYEFTQYLKYHGIVHYKSVASCPQSNGKAERVNQTLIVKAKCMIIAARVDFN